MKNSTNNDQPDYIRSPWAMGSDGWIEIFQFLPDRVIQLYCFIFRKKQISKGLSFILFLLTYLLIILILGFVPFL
jgi:hypothetical protein